MFNILPYIDEVKMIAKVGNINLSTEKKKSKILTKHKHDELT